MRHIRFNRMIGLPVAIGMFALAALPFGAAQATVISASYSGTILAGGTNPDINNLFGGGSLVGDTLAVNYSYDTGSCSYGISNPSYDYLYSCGTSFTMGVAVTTASGTISYTETNGGLQQIADEPAQNGGSEYFYENENFNASFNSFAGIAAYLFSTDTYLQGAILTGPAANINDNYLQYTGSNGPVVGPFIQACVGGFRGPQCEDITANLTQSSAAQPAPEPESMTLLGGGLAALGWARRRFRPAASAQAA